MIEETITCRKADQTQLSRTGMIGIEMPIFRLMLQTATSDMSNSHHVYATNATTFEKMELSWDHFDTKEKGIYLQSQQRIFREPCYPGTSLGVKFVVLTNTFFASLRIEIISDISHNHQWPIHPYEGLDNSRYIFGLFGVSGFWFQDADKK